MGIEEIYLEFNKSVFQYVFSKVKNKHTAEDIVQDIFIKINDNLKNLKEMKKIKSWIFTIARNSIMDYFRKNKHYIDIDELDIPEENERNENECYHKCLTPFINKLDLKYKEALLNTELGTLSQKEYADEVGISYSGMKSRVQRARQKIEEEFVSCCIIKTDSRGNKYIDDTEDCSC